jgi:regulator of protease activity HflC (stomatin/prohibitin superfamily)
MPEIQAEQCMGARSSFGRLYRSRIVRSRACRAGLVCAFVFIRVTVSVNAVVYFRVLEPRLAIVEVENYLYATSQLAQTTLRSVLGEAELDELLSAREKLNARLQEILDRHTDQWGIKVSLVEIKAVDLPQEMRRAMSRQAEAEREKRAKIIHAEGEYQAAEKLVSAAHTIASEPTALQLRYLQTLTEIGVERNTTVVFPLPIDPLEGLFNRKETLETVTPQQREPVGGL